MELIFNNNIKRVVLIVLLFFCFTSDCQKDTLEILPKHEIYSLIATNGGIGAGSVWNLNQKLFLDGQGAYNFFPSFVITPFYDLVFTTEVKFGYRLRKELYLSAGYSLNNFLLEGTEIHRLIYTPSIGLGIENEGKFDWIIEVGSYPLLPNEIEYFNPIANQMVTQESTGRLFIYLGVKMIGVRF